MGIQVAFYKGKGKIGNALVRWWTRSPYSHCEVVFDGVCISSSVMDGGVRQKIIDLDSGHWDVTDVPWASRETVHAHWLATKGQPYGWGDLIMSQVFNRGTDNTKAAFCSEWCAAALDIPRAVTYSPGALFEEVRRLNDKWLMSAQLARAQSR